MISLSAPQKTPAGFSSGVFFRLLAGFVAVFGGPVFAGDLACHLAGRSEQVALASVHDGDSLRLKDGRRVRVVGINAPEVATKGRSAEKLANESTQAARRFLGKTAALVYDREVTDHYGRTLAHVYNGKGDSLAAHLLREGLAFHIAVPPNLGVVDCLAKNASQAQSEKRGVWSVSSWHPDEVKSLRSDTSGYRRVKGRVMDISGQRDIWIEMDGPLVLKIAAADKRYFRGQEWKRWKGRSIEVQGWVVQRPEAARRGLKPLQLQVRTPYSVTVL